LLEILGEPWRRCFLESFFVYQTDDDEIVSKRNGVWIHYDKCSLTALVYLNLPSQCAGGTTFYRHRRTGVSTRNELHTYCRAHSVPISAVMADACSQHEWEAIASVEMQYNRLLVFDSHALHQASGYFGNTLADSRLTQHYVFNHR
jgi:hypothetical protein